MRSPTIALLWEVWQPHRSTVAMIVLLTAAGRALYFFDAGSPDPSPLPMLLAMLAFVLLFAVLNYTEPSANQGIGRFPRRLFTLPVTSLRLMTVPVVAGIVSIEILYLAWLGPFGRGDGASIPFVAVLLAALVVFYLWVLWTLERAGSMRLCILGVITVALLVTGMLPQFPPTSHSLWRSELALGGITAALAAVAFLVSWRHVSRMRTGGGARVARTEVLAGWFASAAPRRQTPFANAAAAHFWFEWRASGMVLPVLVAGVLLAAIMPISWAARHDAGKTFVLFIAAIASPVVLAVPVGVAFSKPTFWSDDLSIPAFIAVRPMSAEEFVAIKMKVAAASAALSWMVVLAGAMVWLPAWGSLETLSASVMQLRAAHGQSNAVLAGMAVLVVLAGISLTWRFLVSRLWSGLLGVRWMVTGAVASVIVFLMALFGSDASSLPGWLFADAARLETLAWLAAGLLVAKVLIAAYVWRWAPGRYVRAYLPLWASATASVLAIGLVVWDVARAHLPVGESRLLGGIVLLALLTIPLARAGIAPRSFARNRQRA